MSYNNNLDIENQMCTIKHIKINNSICNICKNIYS